MHVVSPFFFVSLLAIGVIVAVTDPLFMGSVILISALLLLVCVLVLQIIHKNNFKGVSSALLMFIDAQITLFIGFWVQLRKKPYKWEPLDNTRRY
jgi:predicted membrane-bound dolichyl-phosphate-mannose-protein mannosyltransferase